MNPALLVLGLRFIRTAFAVPAQITSIERASVYPLIATEPVCTNSALLTASPLTFSNTHLCREFSIIALRRRAFQHLMISIEWL